MLRWRLTNRSLGKGDTTEVDTQKDTGCLEGLREGPGTLF